MKTQNNAFFSIKTKAHGSLEKYKARDVAKGLKQVEGIDYLEKHARKSKSAILRNLSLVAKEIFMLRRDNVVSAYLYSDIKQEKKLEQPTVSEKLNSSA